MDSPSTFALDIGSTRVKAAVIANGVIATIATESSPATEGNDPVRRSDPFAYETAVRSVLDEVGFFACTTPMHLGIASQRSSFLLFDRSTGEPATPLISWQDRSAHAWCDQNPDLPGLASTGLRLSPHYAGPKLADLFERQPELLRKSLAGELLFGTLETWILFRATEGRVHRTDRTMASRTLLFDLSTDQYSDRLLEAFGVPKAILPRVINGPMDIGNVWASQSKSVSVATVADQPSGALAAFGRRDGDSLVNFGTGTFVLFNAGASDRMIEGLLQAPFPASSRSRQYLVEGTINSGGSVADRFSTGPTPIASPSPHPSSTLLCLPDDAGIGAPHWIADGKLRFSSPTDGLDPREVRRAVIHGLGHRVREILDRVPPARTAAKGRTLVAGGLAQDRYVPAALAAILARPVTVLEEAEVTLLGAASLAEERPPRPVEVRDTITAPPELQYLAGEHTRWQDFVRSAI